MTIPIYEETPSPSHEPKICICWLYGLCPECDSYVRWCNLHWHFIMKDPKMWGLANE